MLRPVLFLLLVGSVLCACDFTSPYKADNSPVDSPDLPNYIAKDYVLPVGSLIIPMDNTYQTYHPQFTLSNTM